MQNPHRKALAKKWLLGIILAGVLQRLSFLPLDGESAWVVNDCLRTLIACMLCYALVSFIDYKELKNKCISAALFGFFVADLVVCILWYVFEFGGYLEACVLQVMFAAMFFFVCFFRDYEMVSDEVILEGFYCLRKKPNNAQDFVISMAGIFGPYGGYAVCWKNEVYMFHHGVLRKYAVSSIDLSKYHIEYIGDKGGDVLEFSVGKKWHLFGSNCLTFLRSVVNKAKNINLK